MKNKVFHAFLVFAFVAFSFPIFAFTGGSGTYEDPYNIFTYSDVADLISMSSTNDCNGVYFLQTADIDLSNWNNFDSIGTPALPFKGNYDGDGYTLSNLTITASVASTATTNAFGFFGYVREATIENVNVQGKISVAADYNSGACVGVGGVVGICRKGLFAALHNYVDIDFKLNSAPSNAESAQPTLYGISGVLGFFYASGVGTTHYVGLENQGKIYVHGANARTLVGGCVSIDASRPYFDGANNYGEIVVSGQNTSAQGRNANVGGVLAAHSTSLGAIIKLTACSNFSAILCSNSVNVAGIGCKGTSYGNNYINTFYCTNYADIVKVNNGAGTRHFTAGIAVDLCDYMDFESLYNINFGNVKAFGNGQGNWQLAGIYAGQFGSYGPSINSGNKNYGGISANCPNANSVIVGGVSSTITHTMQRQNQNYGNIFVDTNGSVLIGGVASMSSSGKALGFLSDCVNFGSITANGNISTNYSPCVGGIFASTRLGGSGTRDVIISNCYSLGKLNLNLNSDTCYGAIYGVANTFSNYAVRIKNCYALVGEGQNLIGAVNAENGNVVVENCVGIVNGLNGGVAASVAGSNNWSQANTTIVSYNDCYHTPSLCSGNMFSGFFYPAEKTTTFFDLVLPINTALFPTPTDTDKALHNWTKAMGYKRYIKTITNN